jgi:hypothetical protein
VTDIAASNQDDLPPELLAEGLVPVTSNETPDALPHPTTTSYEVCVALDPVDCQLPIRLAARSSIEIEPQSLIYRLYRQLARTFAR